ncbi:MAG: hypothetical protein K0R14_1893 [Burkholderiales bacterium]|jgi:signal transduction histidine kinase/PAS domain-containing protein|nr:hypothetical protein [Burkholderiales bacterium]
MENKIKIAFKNISLEQKAQFADSACLLTISVGQEMHEGELFKLTIDLINKSFKSCIILVDDSLQRYTMALNSDKSPDDYYNLAILEGRNWLQRNKQYYDSLTIPYKILHWDQWLKHDNFKQHNNMIREAIKTDPAYKAKFDKVVENFVDKSRKRSSPDSNFNISRAKQLSMAYLTEECAALCLWTSLNCQFEVYPGPRNEAMSATHKKFVLPKYPELLHPATIRFRHADQFKPRIFDSVNSINDLTKDKEYLEMLENIIAIMPGHVYWLDTNGVYLGCNNNQAKSAGLGSRKDIVGLRNKDLPWNKGADQLVTELDQANWEVMSGNPVSLEEPGNLPNGKQGVFLSNKVPLYNSNKEIIGLVGISIDITAQKEAEQLKFENEASKATLAEKEKLIALKEAERLKHENRKLEAENKMKQMLLEKEAAEKETERLRLENELQKLENEKQKAAAAAEEQEKFRKIVGQMVHDIQSPLASLRGIVEDTAGIMPEQKRITLRQASMRISAIASHMLGSYKKEVNNNELAESMLVSTALSEVVSEKRFEHKNIIIETDFSLNAYFSFTQVEPGQFKRMISNVINNSVQALGDKPDGKIKVELNIIPDWINVFIEDNGCGMSQELINKIEGNFSVTSGKKDGHGIGLTQVRETLKRNYGEFKIHSTEGECSSIMLRLPKIPSPGWIAEEVKIIKGDTIIVLDDDDSIHGTWDSKFEPILAKLSDSLTIKHFTKGVDVINFINSLSVKERDKVCMLTDYELLNHGINGLQVVEQINIKRSTLVTSHYDNIEIRERAANLGVKILPKELVFAVAINVDKQIKQGSKKVDMVCVDDDLGFVHGYVERFFPHLKVDMYSNPNVFLEDVEQYPLNTKIVLDHFYSENWGLKPKYIGDGIEIAKKLNKKGFTNLVMLTGEEIDPAIIPPYLTVILKTDDNRIKNIA